MTRVSSLPDVAVAGAGLIGLSVAFELAERGATVRIYDRGEPAKAASWAGAGMLAPYSENPRDEVLLELCAASLREYPAFVERVLAASGIDPHLRLNGIVHAAFGEERLAQLRERSKQLRERGVTCEVLDRAQTLMLEPWLGRHVLGALKVQGEGCIDNRRLGRALVAACCERGVTIASTSALAIECDERRVLGVRSDLGFTPAGAVVNAAGAWAGALEGVPLQSRPEIEPRKGQMLALQATAGFVRRPTWVPGAYLVPRDDGRLLVGATDERAGFDMRVTAEALRTLLDASLAAAPALGSFSVVETWAGLRPATFDGRPFVGPAPLTGLYVAAGHYRNGILLAPATARLLCDVIAGNDSAELAPFSFGRLGSRGGQGQRSPHDSAEAHTIPT